LLATVNIRATAEGNQAGEVKARGERRRVRSDWMAVERERVISVSSAVMSFEHEGLAFNLLDTPGHQNQSLGPLPHAYRGAPTLPSPARGGELGGQWTPPLWWGQWEHRGPDQKGLRGLPFAGVPILTFVNKLDRSPNCARRPRWGLAIRFNETREQS
jgi:hypothetical protein